MKILSANNDFWIAEKPMVSTQFKTFVILFMIYLVIGILPSILFTYFCEIIQATLKNTNKTKSLASCSSCGYKMELNISYARDTEKAKTKCPVLCG